MDKIKNIIHKSWLQMKDLHIETRVDTKKENAGTDGQTTRL